MPKAFIYTPWEAPIEVQRKCGLVIGKDYPPPIVSLIDNVVVVVFSRWVL